MKKICSIVGARPQFIKLAVVSREIRKFFKEIVIHTGQHFDYNMSGVFFDDLDIPKPDYNLGIFGKSHAEMTGLMMIELEKIFINENPDMVLIFGDTNSTIAAALSAAKLNIPICHVEAGNRFHNLKSPEEINRIVSDHVSSLNMACTKSAYNSLVKEDLENRSFLVGDPMYDAFLYYKEKCTISDLKNCKTVEGENLNLPEKFYYMTCHRQENTDNPDKLLEIMRAVNSLNAKTIYPVHPRNRDIAIKLRIKYNLNNIILLNPISYLGSIFLTCNAEQVITDSGGLQREAFFAKKKCVTILDFECWPETMHNNNNLLSKPREKDILKCLNVSTVFDDNYMPFGDGKSAKLIANKMREFLYD